MKRNWGVVLVSSLIAACGGGSKNSTGASSPNAAAAGDSQLSLNIAADDQQGTPAGKLDLSGPAFSQYDPDAKALLIYVLDPATQPAPSCDTVGLAAMMKQKSGSVAALVIKDFSGTAAKMPGGLAMFVQGDASKLQTAPAAVLDATTVEITSYDAKTIDANVTTASSSKSSVTGKIHGTVCPNTSMQKQAEQVQADQMAKMQANGGAPNAGSSGGEILPQHGPGESALAMHLTPTGGQNLSNGRAIVKLDPKTKTLLIHVSAFGTTPMPSCEKFSTSADGLESGTFAILVAKNFSAHATGKFPLSNAQFVSVDPVPASVTSPLDATTIEIRQFDKEANGGFLGTVTTTSGAKASVQGDIEAQVCPDGSLGGTSKWTKPAKKKK